MSSNQLRTSALARGKDYRQWMDDPEYASPSPSGRECPLRSLLTLDHLRNDDNEVEDFRQQIKSPRILQEIAKICPPQAKFRKIRVKDKQWEDGDPGVLYNYVTAFVYPGVLVLSTLIRRNGPHVSEVALAIYQAYYPDHSIPLRYVFVTNVVEDATVACFEDPIFCTVNLNFSDKHTQEPIGWPLGTEQYDLALGTPIGAFVAAIVIGAFARGTHRISKIWTWTRTNHAGSLDIKFDLEPLTSLDPNRLAPQ
ncbi:hypothetical protein N7462_010535 [Penicillium macrosclerotiorum]|uniref:uncharacterized protein n=1 Tax=Penicillium macrosclerotiorum TaxID=303699 RepID=UPI002547280D|nr:uncharacterized protein N7462_010535 [Penicillium macrosclerotiorum]KAJ5669465.1 hypothetical protein N7462_010535 [Penicillium macrosclerotiorum]